MRPPIASAAEKLTVALSASSPSCASSREEIRGALHMTAPRSAHVMSVISALLVRLGRPPRVRSDVMREPPAYSVGISGK